MLEYARDLVKANKSAVVIFTRGDKFDFDKTGDGYSGNWLIRRDQLDFVIIYCRPKERYEGAEIYIGNFVSIDPAIKPKTPEERMLRRSVRFTNLKRVGETNVNFHQFTGNMKNDFCFIR